MIVYSNAKGGLEVEIQYLPDPHKKMAVQPKNFGASISLDMTFDRGVLTKADATLDGTAVPTAITEAAKTIAPALLAALSQVQPEPRKEYEVMAPHVYKILVEGDSIYFVGGPGDQNFKVTLLPQDKEVTPKKDGGSDE